MCGDCHWSTPTTHSPEAFKALARSARAVDFAAMGCTVRPHVQWLMTLVDAGAVDKQGNDIEDADDDDDVLHRKDMEDGPRFYQTFIGPGPPPASTVLDFVRVSITFPTPALPVILNLTAAFLPYASTLTPFLAALPAPFKFVQHSRAHARANAAAMIADADAARLRGNALYARRERRAALDAYDEAVDSLEHVEVLGYGGADARRARPALAVALANRAAAHLLAGPGQDARKALADGSAAVRADPRYVKGYMRQMRAHELLGDSAAARRVLERAAGKVQGADVQTVQDALDALSK